MNSLTNIKITRILVTIVFCCFMLSELDILLAEAIKQEHINKNEFLFNTNSIVVFDDLYKLRLYSNNADKVFSPASLAKLMTAELVLSALCEHKLSSDQLITIDNDIWHKGGAPSGGFSMFAALNSKISVIDLLHGLIIDNANDAALALSKALAVDEEHFAVLMNNEAKKIGMKSSYFINSTGLPEQGKEQKTTLSDMLTLLNYLIANYPQYLEISSKSSFTWNNVTQYNKNFLLTTLHFPYKSLAGIAARSNDIGFVLLNYLKKDNRPIFIALAADSKAKLESLANKWINWSYSNFETWRIFTKSDVVTTIPVYAGLVPQIDIVPSEDIYGLVNFDDLDFTRVHLTYKTPLIAPVQKGEIVGDISVISDNKIISTKKLVANSSTQSTSFLCKFKNAIYELTMGSILKHIHAHFFKS